MKPLTLEEVEKLEKVANSLMEVRPCNETMDGMGVMMLIDKGNGHAHGPSFTRAEFIQ
jgi:hypothetical protein